MHLVMTFDETRPLCIILKHAYVLVWGSLFPSTFVCVPLSRNYTVLASCFTQMFLPFPLFPNVFLPLFPCSPIEIDHVPLFPKTPERPSRMAWVHLTNTTLYVQAGLSTLELHVLSAICSYSYEPMSCKLGLFQKLLAKWPGVQFGQREYKFVT